MMHPALPGRMHSARQYHPTCHTGQYCRHSAKCHKNLTLISSAKPYICGMSEFSQKIRLHPLQGLQVGNKLELYNEANFRRKCLTVTIPQIMSQLVPALNIASNQVTTDSAKMAVKRVQGDKSRQISPVFREYGLQKKEDAGLAEYIAEVFFDKSFRRGPVKNMDRAALRDQIKALLEKDEPITIIAPMLPQAAASPYKLRGFQCDLADINMLYKMAEIIGTIDWLINKHGNKEKSYPKPRFIALADDVHVATSWRMPEADKTRYQHSIRWWLHELGFDKRIEYLSLDGEFQKTLTGKYADARRRKQAEIKEQLISAVGREPNVMNMKDCICRAIQNDPFSCTDDKEKTFIPEFKSVLFSMHCEMLEKYIQKWEAIPDKYNAKPPAVDRYHSLYRRLVAHIYTPFDHRMSDKRFGEISDYLRHPDPSYKMAVSASPVEMLEFFREDMLQLAWQGAIEEVAVKQSFKQVAKEMAGIDHRPADYVLRICPHAIRANMIPKEGHFGLLATTTLSTNPAFLPHHGAGILKQSGDGMLRIGTMVAAEAENGRMLPIVVSPGFGRSFHPLREMKDQPFFYLDPAALGASLPAEKRASDSGAVMREFLESIMDKRKGISRVTR